MIRFLVTALSVIDASCASTLDFHPPTDVYDAQQVAKTDVPLQLVELNTLTGLKVSPDGKSYVVQAYQGDKEANRYKATWLVGRVEERGDIIPVADGGDIVLPVYESSAFDGYINGHIESGRPVWSSDSEWIIFERQAEETIDLWKASANGEEVRKITSHDGDAHSPYFSAEDGAVYYTVNDRQALLREAIGQSMSKGFVIDDAFVPGRSRFPILSKRIPSDTVWRLDWKTFEVRPATKSEVDAYDKQKSHRVDFSTGGLSLRSRFINGVRAITVPQAEGERAGFQYTVAIETLDGQVTRTCFNPLCSGRITGVWISNSGDRVFIMRTGEHGTTDFLSWSPSANHVELMIRTDKWIVPAMGLGLRHCDMALARIICITETPSHPNVVSIANPSTASPSTDDWSTVFDPNPAFDLGFEPEVEKIRWTTGDATSGYGYWIEPNIDLQGTKAKEKSAVIVQYTCNGFLKGGTGAEFPVFGFAASGIGVLCINSVRPAIEAGDFAEEEESVRLELAGLSPGAQRRLALYRANLDSIDAAIELVVTRKGVSRNHIGITGLSFGAELATYALAQERSYKAAAMSLGAWEPASYYYNNLAVRQLYSSMGYGPPDSPSDELYNEIAISRNVDKINAPILYQTADTELYLTVPAVVALRELNKPAELIAFPNENHIKSQPAHLYNSYHRYIQWFKFWLQNEKVDDPVDAEQYERWRKLRKLNDANVTARPSKPN